MDSTFDEIRRCPICSELGVQSGVEPGPNRSTFFLFTCQNPKCRWFEGAPWIRQRHPDGTWVQAQKHQKYFPNIPDRTEEVRASVDRDLNRQTGQPDRGY